MKTWFTITNKAASSSAEIDIFDEIGMWGITAKDFAVGLKDIPKDREITLRINSPGGSVWDGFTIYNLLNERREKVTAKVYGVAASMASVIMLAAKRTESASNATIMVHNPAAMVAGESEDMRKIADLLDKLQGQLANVYVAKTGKSEAEVIAAMNATTWLTGAEAKEWGLVDALTEPVKVAASFDLTRFGCSVAKLSEAETSTKNQPKEMQKLLKALADAGLVSSADVSEDNAVFQIQAVLATKADNLKDVTARAEKAEANMKTASDKLAAQAKANAETAVAEAVKAGKLKDEPSIRALWIASFEANAAGAKAMLDAIEVKASRGAAPLATKPADDAGNQSKNTDPLARVAAAFSKN